MVKVLLSAILVVSLALGLMTGLRSSALEAVQRQDSTISVRYTDVRRAAGIAFLQDSTQTEEKYYLETMGTGVAHGLFDRNKIESRRHRCVAEVDLRGIRTG